MVFAGVGNVDAHLVQDGRQQRLVAARGIIGAALPGLRDLVVDLQPGWLLVMHTDGVRARFVLDALPAGLRAQPQELAEAILMGWGRATDDATIVVAQRVPVVG
jgi:serine phosphatase RsbU (regulator of sigma subunit)